MEKSLDPRLNRFQLMSLDQLKPKQSLDQLPTFEVFVQPNESRNFQHEGIVHAPNNEMAFIFAKEQFSRRNTCSGIWTVSTANVYVSETTDDKMSIYDNVHPSESSGEENYSVFHLVRRGKQHMFACNVKATSYQEAIGVVKLSFDLTKPVLNVWLIKESDIFKSSENDQVIWNTLPEKQFREAIAYKGSEMIKKFKKEQSSNQNE